MTRTTKADQAREAADKLAQMAWEAGFNHFREDPEADMTTIHRRAGRPRHPRRWSLTNQKPRSFGSRGIFLASPI